MVQFFNEVNRTREDNSGPHKPGYTNHSQCQYDQTYRLDECISSLIKIFLNMILTTACVPRYEFARMTRSACDSYLLRYNWTKTAGVPSFSYAAPTLWANFHIQFDNKRPYSIRSLDSLCNFMQSLKTYLFRSPYS